mmetsp:Transcript_24275/g.40527  ORF Transcript_24275/g.40527 Transcript_24275/m.40527 type:complete len:507 (-) Transcript_24275:1170-2690(-)
MKKTRNFVQSGMRSLLSVVLAFVTISLQLRTLSSEKLSYEYCSEHYGNLTYIPESKMFDQYPPHLLSLPGSGNSWLRLLIEYATGIYTGSMDTWDTEFLGEGGFIGERSCGLRLAVIRAHPHFFDFLNGKLRFRHPHQRDKCKRGLIREMKRMIVLVRNPYDTLWSQYQLLNSLSHSGYITRDTFEREHWHTFAPDMASFINSEFYRIILPIFKVYLPEDLTIVRYEDLLDPIKGPDALGKLTRGFMKVGDISDEKLHCAFKLADKPLVHRNTADKSRVDAFTAFLESGFNGSTSSTYDMVPHKSVLCRLREHFVGYGDYFNYTLFPHSLRTPEQREARGISATLCDIASVWKVTEMEIEAAAEAQQDAAVGIGNIIDTVDASAAALSDGVYRAGTTAVGGVAGAAAFAKAAEAKETAEASSLTLHAGAGPGAGPSSMRHHRHAKHPHHPHVAASRSAAAGVGGAGLGGRLDGGVQGGGGEGGDNSAVIIQGQSAVEGNDDMISKQ